MPFLIIILLFLFPATLMAGVSFHGVPLEQITAKGFSDPLPGEVMLLPKGLGEAALEANLEGESLEMYFDRLGFDYIGPIGPDAALVAWQGNRKGNLPLVTLEPEHRLAADLRGKLDGKSREEWRLIVHAAGGRGLVGDLEAAFPNVDLAGTTERGRSIRIALRASDNVAPNLIGWLSMRPDVYSVMTGSGARLQNAQARRWVMSGQADTGGETLWARGLRGEGQVIAVLDTGADWRNCYLAENMSIPPPPVIHDGEPLVADLTQRKITAYQMLDGNLKEEAMDSQGHGTLVFGNAAGGKLDDPFSTDSAIQNGVAPAARGVIQDGGYLADDCSDLPALGCPILELLPRLVEAHTLGARIHNNSWGDQETATIQNVYTNIAADMDLMTWTHPEFLILCAAGNSGQSGEDTVGSPSTAKNVLSIAAAQNPNADSVTGFSSRGWTVDGRVKPDLIAPGQTETARWVGNATALHCTTRRVQGTSMASPIAAGAIALVRQYYTEGWYPSGTPREEDALTSPSAALLRATVIAGTDSLPTEPPPPSRGQGWGRINLENSLAFGDESPRLYMVDDWEGFPSTALPPREFRLVADGDGEGPDLRIVLAWSDYPATPGASPALVNDLDLVVMTPDGTFHYGNQLDETTGMSLPGGEPDRLNNVEVVRLPPVSGVYTVRVHAEAILHGPQPFALAATGFSSGDEGTSGIGGWMLQ